MQAVIQKKLSENIDKYFDAVTEDKEELIVTRENGTSVVVMDLDEYNSLLETFRVYKDPYLYDKIMRAKKNRKALR